MTLDELQHLEVGDVVQPDVPGAQSFVVRVHRGNYVVLDPLINTSAIDADHADLWKQVATAKEAAEVAKKREDIRAAKEQAVLDAVAAHVQEETDAVSKKAEADKAEAKAEAERQLEAEEKAKAQALQGEYEASRKAEADKAEADKAEAGKLHVRVPRHG